MAFLDNSGDIILDAVLTKAGREKLSSGAGLNITRFACGDDEINYALYDKSHPSGSAYYDLEIMQTPVLEGFTQINANINYGLLSYTDDTLLYLPEMKRLEKARLQGENRGLMVSTNGLYYFAVNNETKTQLTASVSTVGYGGNPTSAAIFVETGLDTTAIPRNTTDYDSTTYRDDYFTISVDNRFISNVYGLPAQPQIDYATSTSNTLVSCASSEWLQPSTSYSTSANLLNYRDYIVRAENVNIAIPNTGGSADVWTNMSGPGLALVLCSFDFPATLKTQASGADSVLYSDYGKVGYTYDGNPSGNFDYIDTMVHITGNRTSVSLSIPVRIIRYNAP